ncbi:MAG: NAD(P)/FAD-dependent oxidoreductase, partial [Saprospiraceae bacterium]|nr:NAD(P)/FAD-dependent oxidoreductase [Saprospiraceae bacterium]
LLVDRFCQVKELPHVYALGDLALMESDDSYPEGHPQVAQVAIQMAHQLSKNFNRTDKSRWKPFRYRNLGTMATIGRNRAVVDLPQWRFSGFFAWIVWLWVHLLALIGVKNKVFVFLNWVWNYFTYDQSLRLIIQANKTASKKID